MSEHVPQNDPTSSDEQQYQPRTVTVEIDPVKLELLSQRSSGAGWFNTVALLAIINSALTFMEANLRFIFGLGFADFAAAVAQASESSGMKVVAIGITLSAAATFYWLGLKARKGVTWAFALGMVLYTLDGMLWVLAQQWLEVGCHAFAVWMMFKGMQANMTYKKLYPQD